MQKDSYQIACSEARRSLNDQLASVDSTDQKAGIFMGFAAVVLALLLNRRPGCSVQSVFHLAAEILLLASVVMLFLSFRAVTMRTGLNVEGFAALIDRAAPSDDLETLLKYQLAYLDEALKANTKLINKKVGQLGTGAILLLIGLLAAIISSYV